MGKVRLEAFMWVSAWVVSRARRPDWGVWSEREKGRLVTYVHIPRSLANIPHSRTHVMQQWRDATVACLNAFCEAPLAEKFATSYQLG